MLKNFKIETKYNDVYDITEQVLKTVEESGVKAVSYTHLDVYKRQQRDMPSIVWESV